MQSNVTSFNYYYYRKYNQVPLPQVALDFFRIHHMTFSDMVIASIRRSQ
jgi:hypothetical protein